MESCAATGHYDMHQLPLWEHDVPHFRRHAGSPALAVNELGAGRNPKARPDGGGVIELPEGRDPQTDCQRATTRARLSMGQNTGGQAKRGQVLRRRPARAACRLCSACATAVSSSPPPTPPPPPRMPRSQVVTAPSIPGIPTVLRRFMRGQSPQDKRDEQDKPHHHGPKCKFHQVQLTRWLAAPEDTVPHGR